MEFGVCSVFKCVVWSAEWIEVWSVEGIKVMVHQINIAPLLVVFSHIETRGGRG